MKKFFLICLLVPLFAISQTQNVVSSFRVFAKPEKHAELQKELAAHAQKYHKGDWKWRVFEIQSGPDARGFHVIEGPLSWAQFDGRGNLGAEHTADWETNVLPLTTAAGTSNYVTFNAELSTVQLTDYADKIIISHLYPKPGMINGLTDIIKKMKNAWAAGNESVAVFTAVNSGPPQMITVTRLKGGLKELDPSFRKPLPERYASANGQGSWDIFLADYAKYVESRWNEMLFYRADLSSK